MKHATLTAFLTMTLLTLFSGCGMPSTSATAAGQAYKEMIPYYAQSLVATADSMCQMAQTRLASATLASSQIDGTLALADYRLNGGTVTVGDGNGHIAVTGSGIVNVSAGFSGTLTVCGPTVASIAGSRGVYPNIYVENGHVYSVDNFNGNLAIKNGAVMGAVTHTTANIAWEFAGSTAGRTYTGD